MKESKNITLTTLLEKHAELYEYFEPGDFTGDLALVEDCLGPDIAFVIAAELGNLQLTIAKNALLPVKKKYILANFNGSNQKALSIKCDLSLASVYRFLKDEAETTRVVQKTLF